MLSLGRNRIEHNAKTKRNAKSFNASLSKFQDFLNKTLTKPTQSKSKMLTPNKTQIERLNFSNTATTSAFLPPKSIDKYRLSSTNRGHDTLKQQWLKMVNPLRKQKKAYFVNKQQQISHLTRKQMKQKIQTNAMQRFQQVFKKQTTIRSKVIEQQQSKRLLGLLQYTSRRNSQKQPQQNLTKRTRPNIPGSKKAFKSQQNQIQQENTYTMKGNFKHHYEFKKTMDNHKRYQSERQSFVNNQKDTMNKVQQGEKIINEVKSVKNNDDKWQQVKMVGLMRQKQKSTTQQVKVHQSHKQINYMQKAKQLQQQEKRIQSIQMIKINQSQNTIKRNSKVNQINLNVSPISEVSIKKEQFQEINKKISTNNLPKKEDFEQQFEIEELQTIDVNKIKQNNHKKIQSPHNKVQKAQSKIKRQVGGESVLQIGIDGQKDQLKEQESAKAKLPVMNVQKITSFNTNNAHVMGLKSPNKDTITIKASRDVKAQVQEKQKVKQKAPRYEYDDDDLEQVVIMNKKDQRKSTGKLKQQININPVSNKKLIEYNDNRMSTTSLADNIERLSTRDIPTVQPNDNAFCRQKPVIQHDERYQQQQQQQQLQEQQQSQQHLQPADQLDYLICLVENLGRYYNKSKQFYSHTESAMVEIVMNHKLTAYYTSQQFYYYLNLFISRFEQSDNEDRREQFYTLSGEELRQALHDEAIVQAVEDLRNSIDVARKLIKHTHEKARIYLKREQKQLLINPNNNYHQKCLTHLKQQFQGLHTLYKQRQSNALAQRLCFLIEMYCIVKALNHQQTKTFEDVEDIGEECYHQHIVDNMHWIQGG